MFRLLLLLFTFLISNCYGDNKFINHYVFEWASKDKTVVENYLLKSSDNPDVTYILGRLYLDGEILEKDINKGLYHITKAVFSDVPAAINLLGDLYYTGDVLKKDIKKAFECYEKAGHLGFGPAQFNAGIVLLKTYKTRKGLRKAIFWLDKAHKNSNDLGSITKVALRYKQDAKRELDRISKANK
jgi:TPR repeat protein